MDTSVTEAGPTRFTATRSMTAAPTFTETTEASRLTAGAIVLPVVLLAMEAEVLPVAEVLPAPARAPLVDLAAAGKREAFLREDNPALAGEGFTVAGEDFTVVAEGVGASRLVS